MTAAAWPSLQVHDSTPTRDTLHMWTQVVGKVRPASAPMLNQWWQVPLYVSARGLTTSAIPTERGFFDIDFCRHQLVIRTSEGGLEYVALEPRSVADASPPSGHTSSAG